MRIKLGIILIMLMGLLMYSPNSFGEEIDVTWVSSAELYAAKARYHMRRAEYLENLGTRAGDTKAVYHATMAANNLKLVDLLTSENHSINDKTKLNLTLGSPY